MQRSPEWKVKGVKHGKKHKKTDSEISRIDFSFVTIFYHMYDICTKTADSRKEPAVSVFRFIRHLE